MSELQTALPPIAMCAADIERLGRLADAARERHPQAAAFLAREVERAEMVNGQAARPGLVVMGSRVQFRCGGDARVREVTLVYPHEADAEAGRISVLTPIGAALIGLSVGQSIEWQAPGGEWRSVTVLRAELPES
jgi:regulator of nucleoside diphosphate kinase